MTKAVAKELGVDHDDLGDAATNIATGSRYLHRRIDWKNWSNGDVRKGLAGYGEGLDYADSILKCEKCLKDNADKSAECKTKECLRPLHGGK